MNVVMIIPTGIGCEIGGHAGDASPTAKLLASVCNNLIIHPNVVNASDINEMTENMWYVEGSILDRFLEGQIELRRVPYNRILLAVNSPADIHLINAASAARTTIGADVSVLELKTPLVMEATKREDGSASGVVEGWRELVEQVNQYAFDALAIATSITVSDNVALDYLQTGGINPWGGVEAIASKLIADALNKPVAHAPLFDKKDALYDFKEIVDPRMSAETVSVCYLHCVLKGLHRAPRIGDGLSVNDISYLISPHGCWGRPHRACAERGVPVIVVRENRSCLNDSIPPEAIIVENYLEAAGLLGCLKAGVMRESVRRPIAHTRVM